MTGTDTNRGLEACKWLAFVFMVADHVNQFLLPPEHFQPFIYLLGRLVFPMFALSLAFGLAGRGSLLLRDTIRRLFVWACIAQIPWGVFPHTPLLNVVFTLACGAVLYEAIFVRGWSVGRVFLVLAAFVAGCVAEYGVAGLLVVVSAMWYGETKNHASAGLLFVSLVLLQAENATFFAIMALPVFWAVYSHTGLPRVRHVFYPAYAGHFVLLAFLRYWL